MEIKNSARKRNEGIRKKRAGAVVPFPLASVMLYL